MVEEMDSDSDQDEEFFEARELELSDDDVSARGQDPQTSTNSCSDPREHTLVSSNSADACPITREMIVRDLDTGKQFSLEPVMRIKDLDTGKEFILSDPEAVEPDVRRSKAMVKDLQTGADYSLDEFQHVLENAPVSIERDQVGRAAGEAGRGVVRIEGGAEQGPTAALVGAEAEAKPKSKPRNPKRWLEKRIRSANSAVSGKWRGLGAGASSQTSADARESEVEQEPIGERRARTSSSSSMSAAQSRPAGATASHGDGSLSAMLLRSLSHPGEGTRTPSVDGSNAPTGVTLKTGKATKVHAHMKLYKEFTDLRMVQELKVHQGAIWTMKFSPNGQYMASAGQDARVRVWRVVNLGAAATVGGESRTPSTNPQPPLSPAESRGHQRHTSHESLGLSSVEEEQGAGEGDAMTAGAGAGTDREEVLQSLQVQNLFHEQPYRVYIGHEADVLDLCWSSTLFLLTSSMDKSVRLWHISMNECLRVFQHPDFVTAIEFNPANDKFFLSGSLDEKLRIWNIPEHKIQSEANAHEMVTALCYSSDGKRCVSGSYKGRLKFYGVENHKFDFVTQVEVKNASNSKEGKKITGLQFLPGDNDKLLVTSNDSRIRLYDGYAMVCKYKGLKNVNSQIRASFCCDGNFIVAGSEDARVYIWSTVNSLVPSINPFYTGFRRDKHRSYEHFHAQKDMVTAALLAPSQTRRKHPMHTMTGPAPTRAASALLNPESSKWLSSLSEEERVEATAAGEEAMRSQHALGQQVITAGYSGEIHVFENFGPPMWI